MKMTTLCYIEKDGKYLMLHRTKKQHDINKDKWIGVGGHAEGTEGPEDCLLREVKEETGLTPTPPAILAIINIPTPDDGKMRRVRDDYIRLGNILHHSLLEYPPCILRRCCSLICGSPLGIFDSSFTSCLRFPNPGPKYL